MRQAYLKTGLAASHEANLDALAKRLDALQAVGSVDGKRVTSRASAARWLLEALGEPWLMEALAGRAETQLRERMAAGAAGAAGASGACDFPA